MMSIPVTPYDAKLEPLRAAIEAGNSDVLKQWVQDGLPVYNPESKCDSVLSLAVKNCQFTMLETLLDIGNWQDEYPQLMGLALDAAVRSKQVDVARLLLDKGASVEGVAWWKIADTHSAEMADVFFKRHKSAAGFEEAIDSMEQGFFSAVKTALPGRPDLENILLLAMERFLQEIHLENHEVSDDVVEDARPRRKSHAERMFGLMRWTGVDVHKVFVNDDGERTSIVRSAIILGTTAQLAGLTLTEAEITDIAKGEQTIYHLDDGKIRRLAKMGIPLNGQSDGTSRVLEIAFKDGALDRIINLQQKGAKLAAQGDEVLKTFRKRLYDGRKIPKGLVVVLSQLLSKDDLFTVLNHPDVTTKFGASASTIVDSLNDPKRAMNREVVLMRLKVLKEKNKDIEWNPRAKEYRIWCRRKFKQPEDERILRILNREQKQLYDFNGYRGTEETVAWASLFVNELFPELEKAGIRISYPEEERDRYYYRSRDRKAFCLKMTYLGISASCRLSEIENHPREYQISPNDKFAWSFSTGRLKLELWADGVWMGGDIFSEKYIFEMLGKGAKVAQKVVHAFEAADRRKKDEAAAEQRRMESERRREKEEAERRKRELLAREEAARRAAEMAAENAFYNDLIVRARAVVDHRLARDFICKLTKKWQADGGLSQARQQWLDRANRLLVKRDPFVLSVN